jgi:hypothetical protein
MHIEESYTYALHQLFENRQSSLKDKKPYQSNRALEMKHNMICQRLADPTQETNRTLEILSSLPYTSFGVRLNSNKDLYFVGMTKAIYFLDFDKYKNILCGNLGKYAVCIPANSILYHSLEDFHFVRFGRANCPDRHFHHIAVRDPRQRNPLDFDTSTCWASIGPLMLNALELVDMALIFEAAYMFLTRIDMNSRLTTPIYTGMTLEQYAIATNQEVMPLYQKIFGENFVDDLF